MLNCSYEDLIYALCDAFVAGFESSYDLLDGEVQYIFDDLIKRSLFNRLDEIGYKKSKKLSNLSQLQFENKVEIQSNFVCPKCHNTLLVHRNNKYHNEGVFSSLYCLKCNWNSSFRDMVNSIYQDLQ